MFLQHNIVLKFKRVDLVFIWLQLSPGLLGPLIYIYIYLFIGSIEDNLSLLMALSTNLKFPFCVSLSFQFAWMGHCLDTIGTVGLAQEPIIGSFNWRFVIQQFHISLY